jgi:hypothetical protein
MDLAESVVVSIRSSTGFECASFLKELTIFSNLFGAGDDLRESVDIRIRLTEGVGVIWVLDSTLVDKLAAWNSEGKSIIIGLSIELMENANDFEI